MEKAKQQVITVTLDQEEDDDDIYETKPEVLTTVKKASEPEPVQESAEITQTEFDSRMPTITQAKNSFIEGNYEVDQATDTLYKSSNNIPD